MLRKLSFVNKHNIVLTYKLIIPTVLLFAEFEEGQSRDVIYRRWKGPWREMEENDRFGLSSINCS